MIYALSFLLLVIAELLYFKVADKYNIIDKPNERSMHTDITIRGGGIIFALGAFIYFFYAQFQYPFFYLGLFLITVISLWDDIKSLPNRYRIIIQFVAIALLCYQLNIFQLINWWIIPSIIVMVGIINAYNFMDGINGITGGYSLVALLTLLYINNNVIYFVENELLIFIILGILVFNFFNFRKKAKCFAGDVGSVSIAFVILFLLAKLIFQTHSIVYIFLLTLYGIDSIFTILIRLYNKENIFKAHKKHLFQLLVYQKGFTHLQVSLLYCLVQVTFNILTIYFIDKPYFFQIVTPIFVLSIYIYFYWRNTSSIIHSN